MIAPDTAADPLRSAALTLHALLPSDRDWLLAQLSGGHRAMLTPLLEELEALGIPGDPSLLASLETKEGDAASAPAWPHELPAGEVATLARVLAAEPPALTRSLLAMHAWTWRDLLLDAVGEDRRRTLEALPAAHPPAPLLRAAILQALRTRCASQEVKAVAPPSRWERARSRLARWRAAA